MNTTAHEPYVVVMPRLGLSMTEGTIVEWHKQDGQWVDKGEILLTFESDKSTLEIEAPASGPLRILVAVGQTVAVQTPVAVIGAGADISVPQKGAPQSEMGHVSVRASTPAGPRGPGPTAASPRARAQARARGLDLGRLSGTGIRGMIVAADLDKVTPSVAVRATPVARRLADEAGLDLSSVAGTGPNARITRADVELAIEASGSDTRGLTGLRGIIAERLSAAWRDRPQVTLTTEADAVDLIAVREELSNELGDNIPFDALFVGIVARALSEFPYMNARLTSSGIRELPAVNVGVAVDTQRGLVVPVLCEADRMKLAATCRALADLTERARRGQSLPDELTGGTFTLTNLGMYGIDAFTPIINPPETGILGIGRIAPRPVGRDGRIVLREQVTLSLSFDHRLVDGAPAARFLARIKELIEQPSSMDWHLG